MSAPSVAAAIRAALLTGAPRAKAMANKLFAQYVPRQMEAPLPPPLKRTVAKARATYTAFVAKTNIGALAQALQALGYGGPF